MGDHDHDPLGLDRRHRFTSTLHLAVHAKIAGNPHWWDVIDDTLDRGYGRASEPGWLGAYARWPWKRDALADWDRTARARDLDRLHWAATDRSSHADEMRRTGVDGQILTQDERWWALEAAGIARGPRKPYEGVIDQVDTGLTWDLDAIDLTQVRHLGKAAALRLASADAGGDAAYSWLLERVRRGTFSLTRYVADNLSLTAAADLDDGAGRFRDEPRAGRRGGSELRGRFIVGVQYLETRPVVERALAYATMAIHHDFYGQANTQIALMMANGVLVDAGYRPLRLDAGVAHWNGADGVDATRLMSALAAGWVER